VQGNYSNYNGNQTNSHTLTNSSKFEYGMRKRSSSGSEYSESSNDDKPDV
jgi:hypothetical protein